MILSITKEFGRFVVDEKGAPALRLSVGGAP